MKIRRKKNKMLNVIFQFSMSSANTNTHPSVCIRHRGWIEDPILCRKFGV